MPTTGSQDESEGILYCRKASFFGGGKGQKRSVFGSNLRREPHVVHTFWVGCSIVKPDVNLGWYQSTNCIGPFEKRGIWAMHHPFVTAQSLARHNDLLLREEVGRMGEDMWRQHGNSSEVVKRNQLPKVNVVLCGFSIFWMRPSPQKSEAFQGMIKFDSPTRTCELMEIWMFLVFPVQWCWMPSRWFGHQFHELYWITMNYCICARRFYNPICSNSYQPV